jgi:hypothetical protein
MAAVGACWPAAEECAPPAPPLVGPDPASLDASSLVRLSIFARARPRCCRPGAESKQGDAAEQCFSVHGVLPILVQLDTHSEVIMNSKTNSGQSSPFPICRQYCSSARSSSAAVVGTRGRRLIQRVTSQCSRRSKRNVVRLEWSGLGGRKRFARVSSRVARFIPGETSPGFGKRGRPIAENPGATLRPLPPQRGSPAAPTAPCPAA